MLEAYERLIHDAMVGDHTLFNTAEGIERLWEVSAPLLEDPPAVQPYARGFLGPDAGDQRADRPPHVAPALRARLAQTRPRTEPPAQHTCNVTQHRPGDQPRRAATSGARAPLSTPLSRWRFMWHTSSRCCSASAPERTVLQRDAPLVDARLIAVLGQGGSHPLKTARHRGVALSPGAGHARTNRTYQGARAADRSAFRPPARTASPRRRRRGRGRRRPGRSGAPAR